MLVILLFAFLWSSPGKLVIALLVVGAVVGVAYMYFQKRRERAMLLVDRIGQRQRDPEMGLSVE